MQARDLTVQGCHAPRPVAALLAAALLAVSLPSAAAAAKPGDPYVTRLTGPAQWITDSFVAEQSCYVLWVTLYSRNVNGHGTRSASR